MLKFKQLTGRVALSIVLMFGTLTPGQMVLMGVGAGATVTTVACGPDDLSKLHDTLNKTAKALNTAIKTNGTLYEQGVYGPVGSPQALDKLHKGAQIVKDTNQHLIIALNLAKGLTKETFEAGKIAVLQALSSAVGSMPPTGNLTLDLVFQSVATFINQAVAIVQLFQSKDLNYALPRIKTWQLPEVTV